MWKMLNLNNYVKIDAIYKKKEMILKKKFTSFWNNEAAK